MADSPDVRRARRLCLCAWGMVLLGGVALFIHYPGLPPEVPLLRPPWGDPVFGPKTPLTVGRIAVMGLGQLGATTTMAWGTRTSSSWLRFWTWACLAAGAKTLVECVTFALPISRTLEQAALALAALPVIVFAIAAGVLWRRGSLRGPPDLDVAAKCGVALSLAVWLAAALVARS